MVSRDAHEEHRTATPLELLFDLCFVVAVARAALLLHHAVSSGHAGSGVVSYAFVFFSIWWTWLNFTWFASAYDNDDAIYRVLVLLLITGALILAAGVPRAFEQHDFDTVFVGYVVMRASLVALWLRAGYHDPPRRRTARRTATGMSFCMVGWGAVALVGWPLWAFVVMGVTEMLVPVWAERAGHTTWHPSHIAERYGLFTIIVLGETILSSSVAFQSVVDAREGDVTVLLTAIGALLTVFAMWWLSFATPAAPALVSHREGFEWGYGHYFVFASAAAVGAGVAVQIDHLTGHGALSDAAAAAAFTLPVVVYFVAITVIDARLFGWRRDRIVSTVGALAAIGAVTFTGEPVLVTGLVLAGLVVVVEARRPARTQGEDECPTPSPPGGAARASRVAR
jgi:low temperature requirement protein LtrA